MSTVTLWYGGGLKKDFDKATELQQKTALNFAQLLSLVAQAHPKMRIRFSTSNPQDLTLRCNSCHGSLR